MEHWSSTYNNFLDKLSTLQTKAVKIVGDRKYYDREHRILFKTWHS